MNSSLITSITQCPSHCIHTDLNLNGYSFLTALHKLNISSFGLTIDGKLHSSFQLMLDNSSSPECFNQTSTTVCYQKLSDLAILRSIAINTADETKTSEICVHLQLGNFEHLSNLIHVTCKQPKTVTPGSHHIAAYKPLFIVIMYSLCSLLLAYIAIYSYVVKASHHNAPEPLPATHISAKFGKQKQSIVKSESQPLVASTLTRENMQRSRTIPTIYESSV